MDFTELATDAGGVVSKELFKVGDTSITLISIAIFILVVLVFAIFTRVIKRLIASRLLMRLNLDTGTRYTVQRILGYVLMSVGILIAFQTIGVDLSGLVVIFGLLSVGIGFGLQNVTSNFISGLVILFERPIKVGDRVIVGNVEGDVTAINMRSTTVRSLNNVSIIVPNHDFVSNHVVNWTHSDSIIRLEIDVGVSYNSDLDAVRNCLLEIARKNEDVLENPAPDMLFLGFGDSAWDLRLLVWINDPQKHPFIRSDINCAIVRGFREKNIEIPFPQRDLHVRSPLPLPLSNGLRGNEQ